MSFQEVSGYDPHAPTQITNFPIFLIPGIAGNHTELLSLARNLKEEAREQGYRQPVYIFDDPRLYDLSTMGDIDYLSEIAQREMQEIMASYQSADAEGYQSPPFLLAGYSFGGPLAYLVAQKLRALNQFVSTCIIDAPTLDQSANYLQSSNVSATRDLIAISNFAARLCMTNEVQLNETEIFALSQYSIIDQITQLEQRISATSNDKKLVATHFRIIKENLMTLMSQPLSSLPPLESLTIVATGETCTKYNLSQALNWDTRTSAINAHYLAEATHTSIISEHKKKLSQILTTSFQTALTERNAISKAVDEILARINTLTPSSQPKVVQALTDRLGRMGRLPTQQPPVFRHTPSLSPAPYSRLAAAEADTGELKRKKVKCSAFAASDLTTFGARPTRHTDALRSEQLLKPIPVAPRAYKR